MAYKILITGLPRSGKTTLLEKILRYIPGKKQGFLTQEVRSSGERIGFNIITHSGKIAPLARTDIESEYTVSRYSVDVNGLESIIPELASFHSDELLYIDEIGQMELFSNKFKELVNSYLESENNFLGVISKIYEDPFTEKIKKRKDIDFYEITPENREEIYKQIMKKKAG